MMTRKTILPLTFVTLVAFAFATSFFFPNKVAHAAFGACAGGPINSVGQETSQSSTVITANENGSIGDFLFIMVAMDNLGTVDGNSSQLSSITDTRNTWSKAGEFTNTVGGAANDGATIAVWYTTKTTAYQGGDNITLNYTGNVVAKVYASERCAIAAGSTISIAGSVQTLANDNVDAGSMTISSLTNKEYFFLRAIASETNTTGITPTTNYSTLNDGASGSGGSEKGHIILDTEIRTLTGTGDTSDPTMTDTTADRASLYIAFQEVAAVAPGFKESGGVVFFQ